MISIQCKIFNDFFLFCNINILNLQNKSRGVLQFICDAIINQKTIIRKKQDKKFPNLSI